MQGTPLFLAKCNDPEFQPLVWQLPNYERRLLKTLEHDSSTNVDTVTHKPCFFLSSPKSKNWWPLDANRDRHRTCLNFFDSMDESKTSVIKYKVPTGYNRFQTHVGISGAGETPVGRITYEVYLDGQFATRVVCEAKVLRYGETRLEQRTVYPYMDQTGGVDNPNYNNRSHAYTETVENDAFMTVKVRNMCRFHDCTVEEDGGNEQDCYSPNLAIDVVIADTSILELRIKQNDCSNAVDPETGNVFKVSE